MELDLPTPESHPLTGNAPLQLCGVGRTHQLVREYMKMDASESKINKRKDSSNGRESTVNRSLNGSIYPGKKLVPFSLNFFG
jgi:hypothetical protein